MSVSVSTFSLVAIAIERYNAICNPLKSRVWQTRSHAYRVIAATWLLSALLMLPYPIYSTISSVPNHPGIFQCSPRWPGTHIRQAWSDWMALRTPTLLPANDRDQSKEGSRGNLCNLMKNSPRRMEEDLIQPILGAGAPAGKEMSICPDFGGSRDENAPGLFLLEMEEGAQCISS
ncbi:hypothetical protein JD844_033837 [Phrynosoma platyrhinos]|uniref:G-protein coupled receptors family 1 profile domain-containing protein n=1 Tax=Phrynosoma platyrhinos TaxID=52577 RepID=A0ABQ7T6L7_PHRPL|nr:hypothetical protein JD844_033837 [Phrynosoma platyrhinos]